MKLTKEQIEQLKKLISRKGYAQIDVQYEILDHVACKVEELMGENPKLSLPDAFQKVHASFGIFGFSGLEESFHKLVNKKLWDYFCLELKILFTSYRLILVIVFFYLMFQSSNFLQDSKSWILMMIVFLFFSYMWVVVRYWGSHNKYRKYASYMSSNYIFQIMNLGMVVSIHGHSIVYRQQGTPESLISQIIIGIILLAISFLFISIFILPSVLDRSIADTEALIAVYRKS